MRIPYIVISLVLVVIILFVVMNMLGFVDITAIFDMFDQKLG